MKTICIVDTAHQYSVVLIQTGIDRFTVSYGKQVDENLTYAKAAQKFGACVMHAASCAGICDNRTRAEARKDGDL